MTIYYSLTFLLLAAEMITFCLLVSPLPFTVRKKLFRFLSESPIIAKVAYGLKISFIFVGILFLDALQRMFRVTAETEMAKTGSQGMHDVRTETNFAARKFYAQRNTYLTGFCLFLSLVLTRTFSIILDLIHTQEEYAKLKKVAGAGAKGDQSKQIEELKKKLAASEAKDRDFANLKKQAAQQAAEFDRLASKYNEAIGGVSDKKSD
ncbi:B-cell receptor-associated protein 31-like-domain-containing protein [Suillus subalutaceus]|uniref:B-cell receptor-associated protein 31-like-domain-containing protein n=1 Tax=Suillus subalutaceus TaxID=48586 RepID=UPI001B872B47|nr:B-cell receptor-associated protein 31-like-domain-containing protein [Suillus subalutaceus]KAG1842376.1 B-cell receptor-associated protein 31-like-domain-containing protein [Suillus subalutaceus]KAG1859665.1 B-cell receptor-associated protein 31-like-domain-containing protein [Suillus subluteus]